MIVMKFGGTSVEDATAIRRLTSIVRTQHHRQPIVAVSAMGKTTNGLLECARLAAGGDLAAAQIKLDAIAEHHFKTADQLALAEEKDSLRQSLGNRFDEIKATLEEIKQAGEVTPQLSDAMSSNGELLSSPIVAAAFRANGMKGVWVDVRPLMRTNDDFTRAAVQFDVANPKLNEGFTAALADGGVPVTQGFIGSTAEGVTTTIGRGGSDYSASIIGAALNADEIQIWTDVDGILTTDPRIVSEAAKVKTISFAEASELAYFGAKVLHPSTLLPAMAKEIPVCVRNSRRPENEGTAIVRNAPPSGAVIKAIAFKRGITIINVASDRMLMAYGFLARLFDVFAKHETSVDMVATSEVSVSVTLDDTRNLDAVIADLQSFGEVSVERDQALICLVGEKLKVTPGVASRIFSSIEQINVSMISHGASTINVSFIVADRDVEQAVKALHCEFFSELDAATFEATAAARAGA
ncbi:MAG TPA: lysine-sensitive aspartokinase 3 [Blastocatellia bacterium]|nr:lysine-sensitive aspartokinase 3 [Blastocatellia bacterium]HMV83366.1 lysine-sensitive aspartokinase 3 [Blastocatellia bacterium]HMX24230.1 lysine-sensitive aspartokinase 3 [Blastocatellia bacterium]HMY73762.1 lysine-sensitive aspartokinase 3 [Blastocatellia bacterium]HMZ18409.1 lysine-sensitive aspartokinase 3 [Blastocatellia bacterium]